MTVNFNREFKKRYRALPEKMRLQFLKRVELLKTDPKHPSLRQHPLKGQLVGYYSINVSGDMRAIFRKSGQKVTFVAIGTHAQLY